MKKYLFLFILLVSLGSCTALIIKNKVVRIASVNNNVCKRLTGKVVLYAIFVDTKGTLPWSDFDINSTLDSIRIASQWLENQASENKIPLDIQIAYHKNNKTIPIKKDFNGGSLTGTLFPSPLAGMIKLNKWADFIAKEAGKSFPKDTVSSTLTKNKMSDRERLIARLRNEHKTDNVVLMYFINNYYKEEMSLTLHTGSFTDIEYCIVSFKSPAVIAHEFLHIFGALDLYFSPFDKGKTIRKRKDLIMKEFPNEIMAFAYKDLNTLNISPLTKYTIGWTNNLEDKYNQMLLGKKFKVLKY